MNVLSCSMRWLKNVLITLVVLILIAIAGGFYLSKSYDSIVKNAVIKNLSKQLVVPVDVQKIEFSVFSSFPYASLDFYNVLILESNQNLNFKDTLLYADLLKLNFNIVDLYTGDYTINRSVAENGIAKLKFFRDGTNNFSIAVPSNDSGSNFQLNLTEIVLNDFKIKYMDFAKKNTISGTAKDFIASGQFNQDEYDLILAGVLENASVNLSRQQYLAKANLEINTTLKIASSGNKVEIKQSALTLNKLLNFEVSGSYSKGDYHFKINGTNLDFNSTKAVLPIKMQDQITNISASGIVGFKMNIDGSNNNNYPPNISAEYSLKNGSLALNAGSNILTELNFIGKFKTGTKGNLGQAKIDVENLKANLPKGNLEATFTINNLINPTISGNVKSVTSLSSIIETFGLDSLGTLTGRSDLDLNVEISIPEWEFKKEVLSNLLLNGAALFNEVSFEKEDQKFYSREADLVIKNNELHVASFTGAYQTFDFSIQGVIGNLLNYWLNGEKVVIKGKLQSAEMQMSDFNSGVNSSETAFSLPKNIIAQLQIDIKHFEYKQFDITNLKGMFTITPFYLKAENISFEGMKGSGIASLKLKPSGGNYLFTFNTTLNKIALNQMMHSFDNFGQTTFREEHLNGTTNATISCKGTTNQFLAINFKDLTGVMDLMVSNGELIKFEPLTELSAYFNENRVLNTVVNIEEFDKRMQHIKFSTLKNTIRIYKGVIEIPEMMIESTAMNIDVEGTQNFDGNFNYGLVFNLKDFLMREQKTKDEFGAIEDDGLGGRLIYLKIIGNTDGFEIELDKEKRKAGKKQIVKQETQEIKDIIKNELRGNPDEVIEEKEIGIIWEEFGSEPTTNDTIYLKDAAKKNKKIKKLFDKILDSKEEAKPAEQEIIWDED